MHAMVYAGPGDLRLTELADPVLGPRDILVRIEACGICGSDVSSYVHGHYAVPGQVLGHEMSSVVEQLGSALTGVHPGQRVAVLTARSCGRCPYCDDGRPYLCDRSRDRSIGYGAPGGFADVMVVRDVTIGHDIIPVPADVGTDDLVWVEPLSVAVHAVRRAGLDGSSGPTLVVGAGSVGLCVLAAAKAVGAPELIAVEPRVDRLAAAASLGVTTVTPAEITDADLALAGVIDTSGSAPAISSAMRHLAPGGRLTLVGLGDGPVAWPAGGVDVVTSFAFDHEDFHMAVDHIVSGRARLAPFISHRYGLAEVGDAISASAHDPTVTKAVVYPKHRGSM